MDHHIGMHVWFESCSETPSLSIPNLGMTLETIWDRFFDKIQKSVVFHIFCTHLHWWDVEYSMLNISSGDGFWPKPCLGTFQVAKGDDFSLLWHYHTTFRSRDRNRFWRPWNFTVFGIFCLCTLYLTVESFRRALWKSWFLQIWFLKIEFFRCQFLCNHKRS